MNRRLFFIFFILFISCNKSSVDTIKVIIPIAPTSLNGIVLSNTKISLSWTDNSTNEDGFKIERKTTSTSYVQIATISKDITSFTDSTLSPNTQYIYRVYSYNSAGSSATYSNELSLKTKSVPQITTTLISSISYRSAVGGGTISSDGGLPITARGIIWDTIPGLTLNTKTKTSDSVGVGNFISTINNLKYNTKYYVRSYAINSTDTSYGNEISFITLQAILPSIVTANIDPATIKSRQAIGGGNITSDGGSDIISRGVIWNTRSLPTVDLVTKSNNGTGTGIFQSNIVELLPNTKYYIRSYAINNIGVVYGNEISITTLSEPTQVQIGNSIWSTKNLDVANYRNGDIIPQVTDPKDWYELTTGAWCYYNNDSLNGSIYGKLYNWYAVNDPRGLAPQGWHIATIAEWKTLVTFLGGDQVAIAKMKTTGNTNWAEGNPGATNESGFSALPGGYRINEHRTKSAAFYALRFSSWWWSATEYNSQWAWWLTLSFDNTHSPGYNTKGSGFSVRCIKD